MPKLYIGAKLMLTPFAPTNCQMGAANAYKTGAYDKRPCTVVYINLPHRWFSVSFDFPYGSFTEAFKFTLPGDCP